MSTGINIATRLPYKVFTALLTQTGVEAKHEYILRHFEAVIPWPTLPAGTTMLIVQNDSESDFTMSGAPDNNTGTWFIYNGVTPIIVAPTEIGGILDIGYDLGAPVATVLENTIGNIWFTYENLGIYKIRCSHDLFKIENTTFMVGILDNNIALGFISTDHYANDKNNFLLLTSDKDGGSSNEMLFNTSIEIRVYN